MRKRIVFHYLLLVAVLFTACSEESMHPSFPTDGENGVLTFILPSLQKGTVSYAIAGEAENALADVTIYMFNKTSGKLEKVFRTADITMGTSGANPTATINVTGKSGPKTFYFVGNGEGRSADLTNLDPGSTLETDFVKAMTDKHELPLATPLLMSGKTEIADINSTTAGSEELKVKLIRRMARLDIDNNASESNFDVKKILVSKAKLRATVFGDNQTPPSKPIEEGNYDPIEITAKTPGSPARLDSVFYLYPTTLEAGKTEIALEGVFNGQTKVYNLKLSAPVSIELNKRYIVTVQKVELNHIEADIKVADWDDAGEQVAKPETDLVTFSAIDHSAVPGIVANGDDSYDLTGVTAEGKLTFTVSSFSSKGTTPTIKYNWGNENTYSGFAVDTPAVVLSYSTSFVQEYEINIPNINGNKAPVEVEITIRNVANPDQKKVITLYANRYADTKLYPTLIDGTYFAPVNAGVSGPDAKVTDHGLLYQWGRDYIGFTYESGINPTDVVLGPMSEEEAENGAGSGKFIVNSVTPFDWLDSKNDNLWSEENAKGPCPQGWRVPTKEELGKIQTLYGTGYEDNTKVSFANGCLEVNGDNETDILYFPAAGRRRNDAGNSTGQNTDGYYWSSESEVVTHVGYMGFNSLNLNMTIARRAFAFPVRCVQD